MNNDLDEASNTNLEMLNKSEFEFSEQFQALLMANLTVSNELDLEKVLQTIADTACDFAKAHYAALGIVNSEGVITSFITSGISQEVREQIGDLPRGHGLLGELIKQGKPIRVRDITKDPRRSGFPPHHPPMTSLLGVPVSLNGQIVGDLYLTDKIGADEFSDIDEWWVILFARQAAVAVQNANLYQKMREAQQRSQTLAELTSSLNQAIEPQQLFDQITQASRRLLNLPAAALYLLNSQRTQFNLQSQAGMLISKNGASEVFLPLEGSIAGRVLQTEKPIAISDTSELPQTFFMQLANNQQPRALLVVPIWQQGQTLRGVIEVYAAEPRTFSSEEIALLEAFAGQAALILERTQLIQQKEEFLSMTAHDLRAPLTAIRMSAGILESSLPTDLPEPLLRLVSNINRNSERLSHLLEDLLDLTRLEQGRLRLNLTETSLVEQIAAITQTVTPLFESKDQKLELQLAAENVWVKLDKHRFEQILVNLLTNANKYTPIGGIIQLRLQAEPDWVTLVIADNGAGIPADEQERIFDRFYRRAFHEQSNEATGSGLGLPIARLLAELHNGKLWVESTEGKGSCFYLKLPRLASREFEASDIIE